MIQPVDFETIEEELNYSFGACGYDNSWLLEDVLVALALYLQDFTAPQADEMIYDGLIRVLIDNNLADVANALESRVETAGSVALNRKVLTFVKDLNLQEAFDEDLLCEKVRQQIRHLNYEVKDLREGLLRELVLQELQVQIPAVKEAPLRVQGSGLFTPILPINSMRELPFSADAVSWDWNEVSLRAGGAIFRSVRVEINADQVQLRLNEDSFIELVFFDALSSLLRTVSKHLLSCLQQLKAEAKSEIAYLSVHCNGMEKILHDCQAQEKREIFFHLQEHLEDNFEAPFKGVLDRVKFDIQN